MFLCVDMEGGTVDRLRDVIAPVPSVAEVAAAGSKKLFRKHGRMIGEEVRALGFNTDFAPVLDLQLEPSQERADLANGFGRSQRNRSSTLASFCAACATATSSAAANISPGSAKPVSIRTTNCP